MRGSARSRFFRLILIIGVCAAPGGAAGVDGRLNSALSALARGFDVPGAVALLDDAGRRSTAAVGWADRAARRPMAVDDRFRVGSVTELWTAALTLALVEQGRLDLDTQIGAILKPRTLDALPDARDVTLRDLLSHRSGLPDYWRAPDFLDQALRRPDRTWSVVALLEQAALAAGDGPRRSETTDIAGTNYLLVERLLETVEGNRFEQLMDAALIRPLDLAATALGDGPDLVRPHWWLGDDEGPDIARHHGDQGLVTNAADLAVFALALFREGRVIGPDMLREMLSGGTAERGLGVTLTETSWGLAIGRDAAEFGQSAELYYFPEIDRLLIVLTNSDEIPGLAWDLLAALGG